MYVGPADFAFRKIVCGLRLDKKRTTTDCDGKYQGERHFRCTAGHGLYIPIDDAESIGEANEADFAQFPPAPARRASPDGSKASPTGDAPSPPPSNFHLEEELASIAGLEEVKAMMRGIQKTVEVRRRRAHMGVNDERTMHMLFLGNPGTGKTTVARLVAKMLHGLGALKKGQLIEVTRKDLIGSHHGETATLTADACKRALGGVLFIDEAYALRNEGSSDSAGQECVNTLVKESEEHANNLVVILAGYQKEMASFLATNAGLSSRFPNVFNFADYSYADLASILQSTVHAKGFELHKSIASEASMLSLVQKGIRAAEIPKGNGRLVRNMVEVAIARQTDRVFRMGTVSRGTLTMLVESDFGASAEAEKAGLDSIPQVIAELSQIVGLATVKTHAKQMIAQLQLRAQRQEVGLPLPADASLHMIFSGNPGTGKTTVARIMAKAFQTLCVLRSGHLVECDRAALVAGYAGQTAIKTKQLVESALGGILFVDEAYALVSDDRDSFGKEALDTLMKLAEDHRDDLVVILAGYDADMRQLLARNPGLKSRFPSTIAFSDYSAPELMSICEGMLAREGMRLDEGASGAIMHLFDGMAAVHSRENGNGRAVRNLLEGAKRSQALRLMELGGKRSVEELSVLTEEDFGDALSAAPIQVAAPPAGPSSIAVH